MSAGQTQGASYRRAPVFAAFENVRFDAQALSGSEIRHLDSLNIQGVMRGVWVDGNVEGLDRNALKGGDILFFNAQYWLVATVLETWDSDGWCHVAVQLQNGVPAGITP